MYKRIYFHEQNQSFFLFGPRGTGKSTWLRQHYKEATFFNFLDEALYQDLLATPKRFADELRALPNGSWVVLDEVQKVPHLLNYVHLFIEEKSLKFVLSGSSARKLKRDGVNLLAGRALMKHMYPFVPDELGQDFNLANILQYGALPIVVASKSPRETLEAYVLTYLREEIKSEALVRNLPAFSRFLPIAALFHGQVLNVSSLARDAQVARNTVEGYLEILSDTLLATKLEAFVPQLRVREKKHPKLYWVDPGLVRAIKKRLYEVSPDERGALLEGYVFSMLCAYNQAHPFYDEIFYWAPSETLKTEVDFLLKRGDEFWAIEVKAQERLRNEELVGLRAIAPLTGLRKRIFVYLGEKELLTEDHICVWPFKTFQERLATGQLTE